MDIKHQIIEELEDVSSDVLTEVLDFLQFLKLKQDQSRLEELKDIAESKEILANLESEGTVSWSTLQAEIN
ncbi:MAG: DUF2281 domain-containing protein [Limnothrix sp. RL_2_0]|nr:DUF2281 domain-containing protein [Limnothrix sp. RL_2_0]